MTHRQWLILQLALLEFKDSGMGDWDEDDGPVPTEAEIDELAQIVGDMDHDRRT